MKQERTRYYVHGDVRDDGKVYCLRCDLFCPRDHLGPDGPHEREWRAQPPALRAPETTDFERATKQLKAFERNYDQAKWFRPKDARNVVL